MSGFSDYDNYDALGLAELVRSRDVTPDELLEEAISRTEKSTLQLMPSFSATLMKRRRRSMRGCQTDPLPACRSC